MTTLASFEQLARLNLHRGNTSVSSHGDFLWLPRCFQPRLTEVSQVRGLVSLFAIYKATEVLSYECVARLAALWGQLTSPHAELVCSQSVRREGAKR